MNTVAAALRSAASELAEVSDTARLDAELLMAEALGLPRTQMLLSARELPVPAEFKAMLGRRIHGEPVAYIIGKQAFYGRDFLVTADVLIPRADSETIINVALEHCPKDARVLDLGIGSGALLLTLLAERPDTLGTGVDASLGAVSLAAANAAKLGVAERAHLLHANWHDPDWAAGLGQFDLIIANPPYVESLADLDRSVRDFEPAAALFAGEDGLDEYRVLIPQIGNLMLPGAATVLEIGYKQAADISAMAQKQGFSIDLFHDLANRPRALLLR